MGRLSIEQDWRNPENLRQHTIDAARRSPWSFLLYSLNHDRVIDQRAGLVFEGLQNGGFWNTLSILDGSPNEDPQKVNEKRQWAKSTFSEHELHTIFDLAVTIALTTPYGTDGAPGRKRGHSILHDRVAARPDSIFHHELDDEMKKRLNNGRFWEELPDMVGGLNLNRSYQAVNDVLLNFSEDLDPAFAKTGLVILERNKRPGDDWNLELITKPAIDKFAEFVTKINFQREELGITQDQLAQLVAPYAEMVVGYNEGDYGVRKANYPLHGKRSYTKRLHEPLLAEYVSESTLVRRRIANTNQADIRHMIGVLDQIPYPQDIFDMMVENMHNPLQTIIRISEEAKYEGLTIKPFLGPKSQGVLLTKSK